MSVPRLWLGGWGIAPETIARKLGCAPDAVLPPTPASLRRLLAAPGDVALGGWSLGARLLLDAFAAGDIAPGRPVTLLRPFLAFPSEAGQGGRVSATQVKFLRRRLAKEPLAALADFYRRAGLDIPPPDALPYPLPDLDAGLALLADPTPVSGFQLPESVELLGGETDPLTDNARLRELLPGLKIIPGAGHDVGATPPSHDPKSS